MKKSHVRVTNLQSKTRSPTPHIGTKQRRARLKLESGWDINEIHECLRIPIQELGSRVEAERGKGGLIVGEFLGTGLSQEKLQKWANKYLGGTKAVICALHNRTRQDKKLSSQVELVTLVADVVCEVVTDVTFPIIPFAVFIVRCGLDVWCA